MGAEEVPEVPISDRYTVLTEEIIPSNQAEDVQTFEHQDTISENPPQREFEHQETISENPPTQNEYEHQETISENPPTKDDNLPSKNGEGLTAVPTQNEEERVSENPPHITTAPEVVASGY